MMNATEGNSELELCFYLPGWMMDDGALIMVACYDIYTVFIMEFMTTDL